MSGRIYDICEFYVCDDCKSFDCYNSAESNFNGAGCYSCNSHNVSPNKLFNDHKFDIIENENIKKTLEDGFIIIDRILRSKEVKEKKKLLFKIYGKSFIQYERDRKIKSLLR